MKNLKLFFIQFIIAVFCLFPVAVSGQDAMANKDMEKILASFNNEHLPEDSVLKIFAAALNQHSNSPECKAYDEAVCRYNTAVVEYFTQSIDDRKNVYRWQHLFSVIIFFIVILIVFMGLYFSALHFRKTFRKSHKDDVNELEINMKGIKINSSVMGIVILVISIAFFFLYIKFVYPIHDSSVDNAALEYYWKAK